MPAKSGASHSFAALISIVIGSIISSYIEMYVKPVASVTERIGTIATSNLGIPLSEDVSGMLVVVALLSFIWGVAYHFARH
jgi:cellobiose-specific phosphotransferase system component IIC